MSGLETHVFPALSDNYGFLLHDPETGACASIDCPEETPIREALAETGWSLTHIFITHHHWDHTQALLPLKSDGVRVFGPKRDAGQIEGLDELVEDGDTFAFGNAQVHVISTAGHTAGHVSYHIPSSKIAFVGDTCFVMGCGRLFEGTPQDMWSSFQKLAALPDETQLFCAHEYTIANARFALTVDPDNAALRERLKIVEAMRASGQATVPTTIGQERATNPYMRADEPSIAKAVGLSGQDPVAVFAEIRTRKDNF